VLSLTGCGRSVAGRQGARAKDGHQLVDLFLRELAGDLAVVVDGRVQRRGRANNAVEHDRQVAFEPALLGRLVLAGQLEKAIAAFGIE
jgi:hypothetical protein